MLGRLNLERYILPHSILLYGSAKPYLAGRHTEALKSQIIPPRPGILTGLVSNPTSPTTLMLRVASNLKIQVRSPGLVGKVRTETRYGDADHIGRRLILVRVSRVCPSLDGASGGRTAAHVRRQERRDGDPSRGSSAGLVAAELQGQPEAGAGFQKSEGN